MFCTIFIKLITIKTYFNFEQLQKSTKQSSSDLEKDKMCTSKECVEAGIAYLSF